MKKNLLVMMAVLAMGMVGCSQAPAMEAPAEDTAVSEEVKSTENNPLLFSPYILISTIFLPM